MLGVLSKTSCPIGIALGYDSVKMAQLATNGEQISVVSYKSITGVAQEPPDGPQWQRWAINALRYARANGHFRGKEVVAALPATELFVDLLRYPKSPDGKLEDTTFSIVRPKMPVGWTKDSIVIKCIPTEQDNVMAIAAKRATIERHLAIYERAHLKIKSLAFWPVAMASLYDRLFARRQHGSEAVVMLLDVQSDCTNAVVCRGGNPLLAGAFPFGVGTHPVSSDASRLVWELKACRAQLLSFYKDVDVERVILLSTSPVAPDIGRTIGSELGVRVQLASCHAALGMDKAPDSQLSSGVTWANLALACGLSLC